MLAGHDPLDSTTIQDPFQKFTLPDVIDVTNLCVGIPKVVIQTFSIIQLKYIMTSCWRKKTGLLTMEWIKRLPNVHTYCSSILCCFFFFLPTNPSLVRNIGCHFQMNDNLCFVPYFELAVI